VPGWLQVIIFFVPCVLPNSVFEGHEYAFDVCEYESVQTYVLYTFSWLFRNFGDGCAIYWRWVQVYGVFYVLCFHYLRPLVDLMSRSVPDRYKTRSWAAISFSSGMMIGLLMAVFHYPNNVLENGTGWEWAWLEIGVDFVQPSLLVFGMAFLPFNLTWWGNTTLGAYVFHFYFKDQVGMWTWQLCDLVKWDATGLLAFLLVVLECLFFTTVLGPIGHYALLTPTFMYSRAVRWASRRRRRVHPRPSVNQAARPEEACR